MYFSLCFRSGAGRRIGNLTPALSAGEGGNAGDKSTGLFFNNVL
jgi:hypothetical protein